MSDDLPIPPPPPKGSDFPSPPPELIENKISTDESEDSFEDIKNSIDNILSEVSELPPPGLDIQPPPLPPGLDMQPPPLPPGLDVQPPPLPPGLDMQPPPLPPSLDVQEKIQNSKASSNESLTKTFESEKKSLSDKLAVLDLSENESLSKDDEISIDVDETSNSVSPHHLRPSTEVDSIPGDKLHAILSEKEISLVNADGSPLKQTIDGELIIKNPSKKHRAWDIEVELSNTASTDLGGKTITVRRVRSYRSDYDTNIVQMALRMIDVREIIDTESEREQEASPFISSL